MTSGEEENRPTNAPDPAQSSPAGAIEPAHADKGNGAGVLCVARFALALLAVIAALAGIAGVILLHGFGDEIPWPGEQIDAIDAQTTALAHQSFLQYAVLIAAATLAFAGMARIWLAADKPRRVGRYWLELSMIVATALGMLAACILGRSFAVAAVVQVAEVFVIAMSVLAVARLARWLACRMHPAGVLVCFYICTIMAGAGLLKLPAAWTVRAPRQWFMDALFTATSAMCDVGLTVRDTGGHHSLFGQVVILCLMQLGGLAMLTFGAAVALRLGRRMTEASQETLATQSNTSLAGDIRSAAVFVAVLTFVLEAVGAVLLFPAFNGTLASDGTVLGPWQAAWYSVFHSVSAFCNAGFSLYPDSLTTLRGQWQVLGVITPLIILGGIGLPVIKDLCAPFAAVIGRFRGRVVPTQPRRPWLSLHTRIVLITTAVLIISGAAVLHFVESYAQVEVKIETGQIKGIGSIQADWKNMAPQDRMRTCVFASISARTAGFTTVDVTQLSDSGKLTLCGLMLVGGSPGGTAGGMKTMTLALLVMAAVAGLRRRGIDSAGRWAWLGELTARCVAMATLFLLFVGLVTLVLCMAERSQGRFLDMLMDACSACSSAGLSTGGAAGMTELGKSDLIGAMFMGRLGLPLLALLLMRGMTFDHRRRLLLG